MVRSQGFSYSAAGGTLPGYWNLVHGTAQVMQNAVLIYASK